MKIVVIGGSGLIGKRLVSILRDGGHPVVAASRCGGVNSLTGEGLSEAMAGAEAVVDVTNSPSFEDGPVMHFFQTSTRNLLAAEATAGVRHHVALSVVGSERLPDSGYFRAKIAQEEMIKRGAIPYTIMRATQFFEFIKSIADFGVDGDVIRLPPIAMQPVAAADVSAILADVAAAAPLNATAELAGPEMLRLDDLARRVRRAHHDARQVRRRARELVRRAGGRPHADARRRRAPRPEPARGLAEADRRLSRLCTTCCPNGLSRPFQGQEARRA